MRVPFQKSKIIALVQNVYYLKDTLNDVKNDVTDNRLKETIVFIDSMILIESSL